MKPPLSPSRARNAAWINQCASPGLGSLLARRYLAGTGQLLLALAGFGMIIAWFWFFFMDLYRQQMGDPRDPVPHWLGWGGLVTFAIAWLLALITSLSLLRQAKRDAKTSCAAHPGHNAPPPLS